MFYLQFNETRVIGASPEVLVRKEGDHVEVRPIAGTRPRGATFEEDQRLEQELLDDPKERAEHIMLVDLGRNDLGHQDKIHLQAGAGIVADSDPAAEYDETVNKAMSVKMAIELARQGLD